MKDNELRTYEIKYIIDILHNHMETGNIIQKLKAMLEDRYRNLQQQDELEVAEEELIEARKQLKESADEYAEVRSQHEHPSQKAYKLMLRMNEAFKERQEATKKVWQLGETLAEKEAYEEWEKGLEKHRQKRKEAANEWETITINGTERIRVRRNETKQEKAIREHREALAKHKE